MRWVEGIRLFVLCLVLLVILDYLWLSLFSVGLYRSQVGSIAGIGFTVKVFPAIMAYFLLATGLVIFVYPLTFGAPRLAFFYGFIYGTIIYGVYDLTNYSVFAKWSLSFVFLDMGWGAILCGLVGLIGVSVSNYLD
jgi:uncharacterized membrane protein